jgi:hypothetical protein
LTDRRLFRPNTLQEGARAGGGSAQGYAAQRKS